MAADRGGRPAKPPASSLGVDLAALDWQRSGTADGGLEVAFVSAPAEAGEPENLVEWVLVRVAGHPDERVLVYDRAEWLNFLDGVSNGEFDQAAELRSRRHCRWCCAAAGRNSIVVPLMLASGRKLGGAGQRRPRG